MNEIKWSNMINLEEFFKNNKIVNYDVNDGNSDVEEDNFDIKEYNEIDISNYNSLDILKLQNKVTDCCNIIIQNNNSNTYLLPYLMFLRKTSQILANKINQKIIKNNLKNNKVIRSSYKFCNFKHKCSYNYDNGKKACYADHYPHNMIYNDCDSLINFINNNSNNYDLENNKEIVKSINTINFVVKHMNEELSNLCIYCQQNECDKFHKCKKSKI